MTSEPLSLIIVLSSLILVIYLFIKIAIRTRKYGGSMLTTMHAATYEFLDKDKRGAAEEIVESKANKKMEEEASDKPEENSPGKAG